VKIIRLLCACLVLSIPSLSVADMGNRQILEHLGKGDIKLGMEYLMKLVDEGNSAAMLIAGDVMLELEQPNEGIMFYQMAADQEHPVAMKFIATAHYKGVFGEPDYEKARFWYLKAAERRNINSMVYLGLIYSKGKGVEVDLEEAYRWFTIAGILKPGASGDKEPEDFAAEIGSSLSQGQQEAAKHYAARWIESHPVIDPPFIPPAP
jgi:hypothetical protein